ncbi:hypothetical protein [Brevibacterium sp.]|uniref:hypothetical protein n=1 Tax=Brevibacterium sp. TaxID=1701 RepID=UPI00261BE7A1|nr:hypothetical protein [Brevibacterium sp.]
MSTTSARLLTWENGTDLVIEMPLALGVEDVWKALTDSASVGAWFAPFRLGEEPAEAEADGPAARPITFELGDVDLGGSVLSCEICDHVLLDLDDFGVLGIGLATRETDTAQGAAGTGQGAADADQETLLVFTQTSADVDTARARAAEFGPMWDTHLRLFARSLGLAAAEATEPELVAAYSDLELDTSGGGS